MAEDMKIEYTPVKEPGLQTLNGLQAVAYCRIRQIGNDFQRTERQRTVLTEVFKKAKSMNLAQLNAAINAVVGNVATSFSPVIFSSSCICIGLWLDTPKNRTLPDFLSSAKASATSSSKRVSGLWRRSTSR